MITRLMVKALTFGLLLIGTVAVTVSGQSPPRPQPPASVGGDPPAPNVKPVTSGTEAADRLAAFRAKVFKGLVPTYVLGGSLEKALWEPSASDDHGTKIVPNPRATGDMLRVQREFAEAIARTDPRPGYREAYYSWLDNNEWMIKNDVHRVGWSGSVTAVDPIEGGGWLVKVSIRPRLYSPKLKTAVGDIGLERYEYVSGRVRFVGSDGACEGQGWKLLVFP